MPTVIFSFHLKTIISSDICVRTEFIWQSHFAFLKLWSTVWPQSISFDVQTGMQLYLILTVFRLKIYAAHGPSGILCRGSLGRIVQR